MVSDRRELAALTLEIERAFDAPIDLVWQAWTDPEHLRRWCCPLEFRVLFAEGELRVGGRWRSGMQSPEGKEYLVGGEYREIEPPRRLVFTHVWEHEDVAPERESVVTITLREENGRTHMLFRQVGFPSEGSRDGHESGWSGAFENLRQLLTDQGTACDGEPDDRTLVIVREFDAPRSLVWRAFMEPEMVTRWWGPRDFTTRVEHHDPRPGGRTRYVMVGPDGTEYPAEGTFLEIVPEERFVTTDEFGEGFPHGEFPDLPEGMVLTVTFESIEERTRLTLTLRHPTTEERRKHEEMGVVPGWNSSFDCLEELLATLRSEKA